MPASTLQGRDSLQRFLDLRPDLFIIGDGEEFSVGFDLEGRWFNALHGPLRYRRGMNGSVTRVERAAAGNAAREPERIADEDARRLTRALHNRALEALVEWRRGDRKPLRSVSSRQIEDLFEKIASWDDDKYARHVETFHHVYGDVPVMPPDQYLALYLQPVVGCRYNRCAFCTLYSNRNHLVRSDAEWRTHLEDVRDLFGAGLAIRKGLFLGDANALDAEPELLAERLAEARHVFPEMWNRASPGIAAFQDAFGPEIPRDTRGYAPLVRRGLRRIYVGLETGNDVIRKLIAKPGRAAEFVEGIRLTRRSGLAVGIMIIAGLGGREMAEQHLRDTVQIIGECDLGPQDRVFVSPLEIEPGSAYDKLPFTRLDARELAAHESELRTRMPATTTVMTYRVRNFLY